MGSGSRSIDVNGCSSGEVYRRKRAGYQQQSPFERTMERLGLE